MGGSKTPARLARVLLDTLIEEISSLPRSSMLKMLEELESLTRMDIAAAYTVGVLRLATAWLEWAEHCSGRRGAREPRCRELEELAASHGLGVVTYMNAEVKRMLARFLVDFAPALEFMPTWAFRRASSLVSVEEARMLARLPPEERGVRLPYYAAVLRLLENKIHAMTVELASRSEIAHATAAYLYWDVVHPLAAPVKLLEDMLGVQARLEENLQVKIALLKLYEEYRRGLVKLLAKRIAREEGL